MYEFIYGHDRAICEWVVDRLHGFDKAEDFAPYVAIGLIKNGKLIAGVIYNNYRKHSIEMTIVAIDSTWATKNTLRKFYEYPFNQLGVARVTATIAKPNKRARKMVERLGYKLEGVARHGMDGVKDACIYGMLKKECKWLGDNYGKK